MGSWIDELWQLSVLFGAKNELVIDNEIIWNACDLVNEAEISDVVCTCGFTQVRS